MIYRYLSWVANAGSGGVVASVRSRGLTGLYVGVFRVMSMSLLTRAARVVRVLACL